MPAKFIAMLVACFAFATTAYGRNIEHSSWDSEYQTESGRWIQADLRLDGHCGSYRTRGGARGELFNIRYRYPDNGGPQGVVTVTGQWRFQNGQSGYFTFYVNELGDRFDGTWTQRGYGRYSPPARPWDGRASAGPPLNGPIYP